MDAKLLVESLGRRGYTFTVVDGRLFVEPKERIPLADLDLISRHMKEVIAVVEEKPPEKTAEEVMEDFHRRFGGDAISEGEVVEMKEYIICRFDGEEPMVFTKEFIEWWTAHNKRAREKACSADGRSKAQVKADRKKSQSDGYRNMFGEE